MPAIRSNDRNLDMFAVPNPAELCLGVARRRRAYFVNHVPHRCDSGCGFPRRKSSAAGDCRFFDLAEKFRAVAKKLLHLLGMLCTAEAALQAAEAEGEGAAASKIEDSTGTDL